MTTTVTRSTGTDRSVSNGAGVLAGAETLAPTIAARAAEVEQLGRVPDDLLDDLAAIGCFRMLRPNDLQGLGADLPTVMRVVETLSRVDASVGWTAMIGSATWVDLAGLPMATLDEVFADPDVRIAGVFAPGGTARRDDGGYRVTGRWAFASGAPHADWLYGNCMEAGDGGPHLRIALFSPDQAVIEDSWHVAGMCGTASHHVRVDDLLIPADRTWPLLEGTHTVRGTTLEIPVPSLFAMLLGAVAVGVGRGALDDVQALAGERVPLLAGGPMATDPGFQRQLAAADTELRASRALLFEVAGDAWDAAGAGDDFDLDHRIRIRTAATFAMQTAARTVTAAFRAGGGGAVYLDSPLQRRLRDIHVAGQHFLVRDKTFTTAGAGMLGQEITDPVF